MSLEYLFGELPRPLCLMNGETVATLNLDAYIEYVEGQKRIFKALSTSAIDPYDNVSLSRAAQCIYQHSDSNEAIAYVTTLSGTTDTLSCHATVDLLVRLICMVEVGCLEKSFGFMHQTNPRPIIQWVQGNVADLTKKQFPVSSHQDCNKLLLTPAFDAWSLENVAGIKIESTDNLTEHLRLTNNNTQLYVFHHVGFLELQRHIKDSVLPDGLAEETLRTLGLLFPQSDHCRSLRSTRKKRVWFERLYSHSNRIIDRQLSHCGTSNTDERQNNNFRYWKDRLLILKEEFDHSMPDSLSQWWYDRRNGVQWHNFWMAMVVLWITAMFGLIQCVLASLQVYKAYHPS